MSFKKKSAASSSEERMDVYIKLSTGRVVPMMVGGSTTISSLCSQLSSNEPVPSSRISLKYQGKVLDKCKTVGEYGVCKETVLRVEILESRTLNIFIKTEESRSIPLTVESTSTVAELKKLIHTKENIAPYRQTLKVGGRVLSSGPASLEESGVDNESVLKLTVASEAATPASVLPGKNNEELNDEEKQDVLASFAANFGADQVVDVVFSFDTTGSMYSCLAEVRQQVGETVERLLQDIPNIQIGIIAHGDYCDQNTYVVKQLDLTSRTKDIVKFVRDVPSTGGGDAPECYEWVLVKAQKLSWRENSAKALVVIGDALPHEASYTDQDVSWREELAKLTDMGVKVYGVQALNNSDSKPFYKELARYSGGKYLRFANFRLITDMFLAVCYGASCPQQLQAYQLEVETEGRMTEELGKVFEELHKETEEAEDVKAKKEKAVADDSKGGETTAKALNLDDDYSSPNAVHKPWWSRNDDHRCSPKYTYDKKKDYFSSNSNSKSRALSVSSSSSSSVSSYDSSYESAGRRSSRTRTTAPSSASKKPSRWSFRSRSSSTSAAPKRKPCLDIAPVRDEYHIGVLGASGVGKTSLISQYTSHTFLKAPVSGVDDRYRKEMTHRGRDAALEIADSASTNSSIEACLRFSEGFVVVYAMDSKTSLEEARDLCIRVRTFYERDDMPIILVANKSDLSSSSQLVTKAEGSKVASEFGCELMEVSAKDYSKAESVFMHALKAASTARDRMSPARSTMSSTSTTPKRRRSFVQRLTRSD